MSTGNGTRVTRAGANVNVEHNMQPVVSRQAYSAVDDGSESGMIFWSVSLCFTWSCSSLFWHCTWSFKPMVFHWSPDKSHRTGGSKQRQMRS